MKFTIEKIGIPDKWRQFQEQSVNISDPSLYDIALLRLDIHIGIYLGYFGLMFN